MAKLAILLLFALATFPITVNSQNIDKPVHELERRSHERTFEKLKRDYPSDTSINAIYYHLDLAITSDPDFLKGSVTINSLSRENNLSRIFYDLSDNLNVDSVTHSSGTVSFKHTDNKIYITLPHLFDVNELISLTVHYHGVPVPTGYGSFIFGSHGNNEPAIWTLSEPFGSSDWFPCKNTPGDKVDSSKVWLTCSDKLIAVSNGLLTETLNNGDGTLTFKWRNSYPIANYLISLAISNYAEYNFFFRYSPADSMPVVNYIYPENLEGLKKQLFKTNHMLEVFSAKYGPYPFLNEKYGHAEFGRLAGMEHQTISSIGVFGDNIMAHELSHQWFGDKITCRNWENIWLNEGFATYGEAIWQEESGGQQAYDEFIQLRMSDAKRAVGSIYVQDVNSIEQIFSGNRSYAKGCIVLHMLRNVVGDSVYFNIIRTYANDTLVAYKTAVTSDFVNVAEKVSGKSLSYFFDQWIFGENYPVYNASWTTSAAGDGNYKALITITQDVNTNPEFFTMPLQIQVFTQSGDTIFNVFNSAQTQTFELMVSSNPLEFRIDPNHHILRDVRGEIVIPVSFTLSQNFPNPFNPSTTISYQLGKPSEVTLKIYNVLGEEISIIKKGIQREGNYSVDFNATGLASGVYFYKITALDFEGIKTLFEETKRMILVR